MNIRARSLPPDFRWDPDSYGNHWLKCDGEIIANASATLFEDKRWITYVNKHVRRDNPPSAYAPTKEMAYKWIITRATANETRLRRQVQEIRRKP